MAVAAARAAGTVRTSSGVELTSRVVVRRGVSVALPSRSSAGGSGTARQLWCQAAAVTSLVRDLGSLDRAVEFRCVEDSRAALRGSFEAASVAGAGPVVVGYDQNRMYYGRRGGGDGYTGVGTVTKPADADDHVEEEEEDVQVWSMGAFEAALQGAGRNAETLCQLATRAWRKLGDADRAEQLFTEALRLAPQDSAVQACYAQFLWQCDAAS